MSRAGSATRNPLTRLQNEDEVGAGIKESGISRSELFITSKVWCTFHDNVAACLDKTLTSLGTDYLDLYLIHWPVRTVPNGSNALFPVKEDGSRNIDWEWQQKDTWAQMEKLLEQGRVKAIGVSNFSEILLEELKKTWKVVPVVNQVRLLSPFSPIHFRSLHITPSHFVSSFLLLRLANSARISGILPRRCQERAALIQFRSNCTLTARSTS
jgi:aryl-alcohol dehydrogenase-like predicted oxidoreductase